MADYGAIANKYGQDFNLNSLRGSKDSIFEGLNPDDNWNQFRGPQTGAAAAPSASPLPPSPSPSPAASPAAPAAAPAAPAGADNTAAMLQYMQQRDTQRDTENAALKEAQRSKLLELMGQDTNAASVSDPDLKPQADAYRLAQDRSAQQQREQLAERAAFMGLNSGGQGSGAFESGIQGITEQAGENTAGFNADLIGRKIDARRQQLMQALQLADALGARSESQTLQSQLAALDAQMRQNALGVQNDLGRGQLGLGLLNTTLNNQQFYDRLGYDYAGLSTQANRDAYLAALGG